MLPFVLYLSNCLNKPTFNPKREGTFDSPGLPPGGPSFMQPRYRPTCGNIVQTQQPRYDHCRSQTRYKGSVTSCSTHGVTFLIETNTAFISVRHVFKGLRGRTVGRHAQPSFKYTCHLMLPCATYWVSAVGPLNYKIVKSTNIGKRLSSNN